MSFDWFGLCKIGLNGYYSRNRQKIQEILKVNYYAYKIVLITFSVGYINNDLTDTTIYDIICF
jgi:hypothetical protein